MTVLLAVQNDVVNAMETFACEGWTEVETLLTMLEELKAKVKADLLIHMVSEHSRCKTKCCS